MNIKQITLFLSASIFLSVGLPFLFVPSIMSQQLSVSVSSVAALTEVRAMYGGLEVGLGLYLLLCLATTGGTRSGLSLVLFVVAGLVAARVIAVASDQHLGLFALAILILEILWLGVATFALVEDFRKPSVVAETPEELVEEVS